MIWIAFKMLTGDRAKYLGIVFGVMFATVLIAQQVSIFVGILSRTTAQITDITDCDIWVMDRSVRYFDEPFALSETDLYRVRGVQGVDWAVKLYRGNVRCRLAEGNSPQARGDFRSVLLMGLDDTSLAGAPRDMVIGKLSDLKKPDAVIIDAIGYDYLFPGEPLKIGQILEMNDRRAEIVGICKASPPFTSWPVMFTRYSQAMNFAPPERRLLPYILVKAKDGEELQTVCDAISRDTQLQALTSSQFSWKTIQFYLKSTGIPVNFGVTVMLGFVVGIAIAGQTFYLFTVENLKQFGALKAMGVSNLRILQMILFQGPGCWRVRLLHRHGISRCVFRVNQRCARAHRL